MGALADNSEASGSRPTRQAITFAVRELHARGLIEGTLDAEVITDALRAMADAIGELARSGAVLGSEEHLAGQLELLVGNLVGLPHCYRVISGEGRAPAPQ